MTPRALGFPAAPGVREGVVVGDPPLDRSDVVPGVARAPSGGGRVVPDLSRVVGWSSVGTCLGTLFWIGRSRLGCHSGPVERRTSGVGPLPCGGLVVRWGFSATARVGPGEVLPDLLALPRVRPLSGAEVGGPFTRRRGGCRVVDEGLPTPLTSALVSPRSGRDGDDT